MLIAVVGGTGVLGTYVVAAVDAAGHRPVALARSTGVDIVSGHGLDAALDGVASVIDVSNVTTMSRQKSVAFFTAGTANLLAAEKRLGTPHHVALSIVGIDRVDFPYYAGKLAQEALVLTGDAPTTVLRATQFHEFASQVLDRGKGPVAVVPRMRTQPVAAREVAAALVELAAAGPIGRAPDLAGPEVHELPDLARQLLRAQGSHRRVVGVRLPGATGTAMASGALLPTESGPRGVQTFQEWLETVGTQLP